MSRVGENIRKAREEAKLSAKQLGKKLGLSESNIIDIENGKKVINEAMIARLSKVLNKNINQMGLSSFETESLKEETNNRIKKVEKVAPKTETKVKAPVNELWDQAFGNNLKNIPVYDISMKKVIDSRTYPVHQGKIENQNVDKVFALKYTEDDLTHYGILKSSILIGHQAKEVLTEGIYIFEHEGQNYVRKCKNLGNGNILTIRHRLEEVTKTISAKEIKVIGKFIKVETIL